MRVVITGIGVVSAFGASREEVRDALLAGRSGIAPLTTFDVSRCRTQIGAAVSGFEPTQWIPPMKLRRMDDAARYAVVVAQQAFADAQLDVGADGDDHAGVALGTFTAGGQATSEYLTALHKGGPSAAPAILFNSTVSNAAASLAGLELKLRGPNLTVTQKEGSGLAAIVAACDAVRFGRAQAMVAGGVDAIFEIFFRVHDRFAVMAPESFPPGPFERQGRGFVLGEGGFALLMESEERWRQRAGRSYGEVLGVAAGSAPVGINQWPQDPAPIVRTLRAALDDAGLEPGDVHAVYAAANGSSVLDRTEAAALTEVFGAYRTPITSIKGALGECGASSAASCVAALLCAQQGQVAPIAGLTEVDPSAAALNLVRQRSPLAGPVLLVNSVSSGGALCCAIFRANLNSDSAREATPAT